ncbi:macrolide transport system ATP-binding/permease protein [Nocardioides exalbidus]|uniref:Macrolide transport system ATP-binding/permease protein n=1 Tax=Nocardioides exalbidus TaxID=402596 RepID=A0A1H4XMT1_9ACTN|nr:ABC-F family ATP-binding cassette domain-containing protein [Nocardioides exalbidus]SED06815.1 macrolide transport system ATP-binding/permease protein [Nocardioides exalbidus]
MPSPSSAPTAGSRAPLTVTGLSVTYPDRTVLAGVDLVAQPGRRIGLVGENGVGKSTLLRAVAGRLPSRARVSGSIVAPDDLVLLGQEAPFPDRASIADVLARTLAPLRDAVADVERLAAALGTPDGDAAYAGALELAVAHDAWDADRRAEVAAARLGLDGIDPSRRVGTLSGGQRTRLALATIMTTRPTCLLLDEPTNHLDDDAIDVLTGFLRELPGVVLLASHDRVLLDDVCTDLVDLDAGELGTDGQGGRRFGGGWSDYEAARADARRRWEETYLAQQEEIGRLRDATRIGTGSIAHDRGPTDGDKFIYAFKGSRVDQALARRKKDAQRRLEVAEREQVRKPPAPLVFRGDLTAPASGRLLQVRDLEVAGRARLARLDLGAGEHLLLTGPNGSGKSTVLGVLSGRLTATRGSVEVSARTVRELTQDPEVSDPSRSALSSYDAGVAHLADPPRLRDLGLLYPRDHRTPVGSLSVGQRRRLGLAIAIAASPDLLLLDEPTNHLSLALAGELEEALATAPGGVVLASHDRWLRRRWEGPGLALTPW